MFDPPRRSEIVLRSVQRFFERNHDVRLDIAASRRARLPAKSPSTASEGRLPASSAKKRFEEIAETGAVKFKFDAPVAAGTIKSAARLALRPHGGG